MQLTCGSDPPLHISLPIHAARSFSITLSIQVDDLELGDDGASAASVAPTFVPGPLKNLVVVDEMESSAPITDSLIADLCGEGTSQVPPLPFL